MENKKPYYIGLDIGTNSCGYAAVYEDFSVARTKGRDLWGVRLFDEGKTAQDRRLARSARRSLKRAKTRNNFLKSCFKKEIDKIDPTFFLRLKESGKLEKDRSKNNMQMNSLFNDPDYTDKEFREEYPTDFHLHKELITSKEKHDVRLVYLSLLNHFNNRGNFYMHNVSNGSEEGATFEAVYKTFQEKAKPLGIAFPDTIIIKDFQEIICNKETAAKEKESKLKAFFSLTGKGTAEPECVKLVIGMTANINKIFPAVDLGSDSKINLSSDDVENTLPKLKNGLGEEEYELIEAAKIIYDHAVLHDILDGEPFVSFARVKAYDKYGRELALYKDTLKRYDKKAYHMMFKKQLSNNYCGYTRSGTFDHKLKNRILPKKRGDCKDYAAFKKLSKETLKALPEKAQQDPAVQYILDAFERNDFLRKQRSPENGVVPNSLLAQEVQLILENASNYLPFLNEKDPEFGLTVKEKLYLMFTYNREYYIGPIYSDQNSVHSWTTYKEGQHGAVYPWNIDQKIDISQSAEQFIQNRTKECTYLPEYKAMPKNALLYQKFMVLSTLNNVRVKDLPLTVEQKQKVFKELYLSGKNVTANKLIKCLNKLDVPGADTVDNLKMTDMELKASLESRGHLLTIFDQSFIDDPANSEMLEEIILWATIFNENSQELLRQKIQDKYSDRLTSKQIEKCSSLSFTGWGRLSKAFILTKGTYSDEKKAAEWGEHSIIDAMWVTNLSLMELLSGDFTYLDSIKAANEGTVYSKALLDWTIDDLNSMGLSGPVKRMVWQSITMIKRIIRDMGYLPAKIFVEMPRGDGEKKRTESRKEILLKLYKNVKDPQRDWKKEIGELTDSDLRSDKLYLYYRQMGRCMYSGKAIPLNEVHTSKYDKDHIIPKSKSFENRLDTNLILVDKSLNGDKQDNFPIDPTIQERQKQWWKYLYDKGFISKVKYQRLIRTEELSEEELQGFIDRQLTATQQGSKVLTQIFRQAFPDEPDRVGFVKTKLISDFRAMFDHPKVRILNDCHHAQDAYLAVVCGLVSDAKYNKKFWLKGKRPSADFDKMYKTNVYLGKKKVWDADNDHGSIATIEKMMAKTSFVLDQKFEFQEAELFKETILSREEVASSKSLFLPVKRSMNVADYGGKGSVRVRCYALVEYDVYMKSKKAKTHRRYLDDVYLYHGILDINDPKLTQILVQKAKDREKKEIQNFRIVRYPVCQNTKIRVDGFDYFLGGSSGSSVYIRQAVPLFLSQEYLAYLKKVEKAVDLKQYDEIDKNKELVLTRARNLELYDAFIEKMSHGIFVKQKVQMGKLLLPVRDRFAALSIEDQCQVLYLLFVWNAGKKQTIDLRRIGLGEHAGSQTLSRSNFYYL